MHKIQKQIAASTDTIMTFTEEIYKLTLLYGNIPHMTFELKRKVILEQLNRLYDKLKSYQSQIEEISDKDYDLCLSEQILIQNILLTHQNIQTLQLFQDHSEMIQDKLKVNHALENQIFINNIQQRLHAMMQPN